MVKSQIHSAYSCQGAKAKGMSWKVTEPLQAPRFPPKTLPESQPPSARENQASNSDFWSN